MLDEEKWKVHFRDYKATYTENDNVKIIDFNNPKFSDSGIRFLIKQSSFLHISGECGRLMATSYFDMTFDKVSDFSKNIGYFAQHVEYCSRDIYRYNKDKATEQLRALAASRKNMYYAKDYEEKQLCHLIDETLQDFNEKDGIGVDGMERLSDFCNFFNLKESPFDFGKNIGREETGILDVYMLAFRLAMKELKDRRRNTL